MQISPRHFKPPITTLEVKVWGKNIAKLFFSGIIKYQGEKMKIVISLIIIGSIGLLMFFAMKNNSTGTKSSIDSSGDATELKIETLQEGTGNEIKDGDVAVVNYTGKLTNGEVFDSSLDRGIPFNFNLGAGEVIGGWDQGILGMKVGEKRKLTIPPDLGYGKTGSPPAVPPNATLIFEVELLEIK